jgi:hypothetical protein
MSKEGATKHGETSGTCGLRDPFLRGLGESYLHRCREMTVGEKYMVERNRDYGNEGRVG